MGTLERVIVPDLLDRHEDLCLRSACVRVDCYQRSTIREILADHCRLEIVVSNLKPTNNHEETFESQFNRARYSLVALEAFQTRLFRSSKVQALDQSVHTID